MEKQKSKKRKEFSLGAMVKEGINNPGKVFTLYHRALKPLKILQVKYEGSYFHGYKADGSWNVLKGEWKEVCDRGVYFKG